MSELGIGCRALGARGLSTHCARRRHMLYGKDISMHRRLLLGLAAFLLTAPSYARIVRIVVEQRESAAFQGQSFGSAGPYQRLSGHIYGELDPKSPLNSIITDIEFAPRNVRGMVEYSATFSVAVDRKSV